MQDLYPGNHCFGCGPANQLGLQLKSYPSSEGYIANFLPSPQHNAGPEGWLNGGIVATIMDCHSIFTAIGDAYERDERVFAGDPLIWYVTGSLSVRYERPVPIDREVQLVAHAVQSAGRKTDVDCTLLSDGVPCATARVVAIRVGDEWKNSETRADKSADR